MVHSLEILKRLNDEACGVNLGEEWRLLEYTEPFATEPDTSLAASECIVRDWMEHGSDDDLDTVVMPAFNRIISAAKERDEMAAGAHHWELERDELAERLDKAESFLFAKSRGIGRGQIKGYDDDDLKAMFGPYLLQGEIKGLAPREVRMLETIRELKARIAELEAETEAAKVHVLNVPPLASRKPLMPDTPDPGEGWRFLQDGEIRQEGDEIRTNWGVDEWQPVYLTVGLPLPENNVGNYRRRITDTPSESNLREWWLLMKKGHLEIITETDAKCVVSFTPALAEDGFVHVREVLPTDNAAGLGGGVQGKSESEESKNG